MNKKVPIIIICVLMFIIILLLIVFKDRVNDDKNVSETSYLVIGDDSVWMYDDKWQKASYNLIESRKMNVYIDSLYKGSFTMKHGNKWNLFLNNDYYSYDGEMIAFSSDFIHIKNFSVTNIDNKDLQEINKILKFDYKLDAFSTADKINIDLNNDGELESIINVSNLDKTNQDTYFNLLYVYNRDDVDVLINEDISPADYFNAPVYNINYILDVNNQSSILIKKGYFSDAGKSGNAMYQLRAGKYKIVMED